MCGRYTLVNPMAFVDAFGPALVRAPLQGPRYNVAPTQEVPVLFVQEAQRVLEVMRWGLIPPWAKDPAIGSRMINARAETAAQKPSFRSAFRSRRCLLAADGFYEWKKVGSVKQPMYIRVDEGKPFALAGLYEIWSPDQTDRIVSCTILTSEANTLLKSIHPRMPVILPHEHHEAWLDSSLSDPAKLQPMLRPFDAARMDAYPVSKYVNSPGNDSPECVAPLQ